MKNITFPVLNVVMIPASQIQANDYNPNKVATPEMELLIRSIEEDGVTQPIVTFYDKDNDEYIVIDGFHRYTVLTEHFKCKIIPIVIIEKDLKNRMASTIRHNRARGKHQVDLMASLVNKLLFLGFNDVAIAEHLGMSEEELLRLKQIEGIAKLLAGSEYSKSWACLEEKEGFINE
jgi:ParB-like chromosome segregation protein Spo0J